MPRFIEGLLHSIKRIRHMAGMIRSEQLCCSKTLEQMAKVLEAEADREDTPTMTVIVCACGRVHSRE